MSIETIGKVTLNLEKYSGQDFYSDGASEDALLNIVKEKTVSEYADVLKENPSWEFLYHLSPLRANIVEWISITKDQKVLEVGSGCGAITGMLAKKAGSVTCVELSKKRSTINAYRNKECDNIEIEVGNFQDIEPDLGRFDYILLIGVLEYAGLYIDSKHPYEEFINILRKHLSPGGKLVIAIENRLGMKYFSGCVEDHLGNYFSGLENYPKGGPARTFSRNGLEKICQNAGVSNYCFYYPYPDYKFMHTLYSDDRLPRRGELSTNLRNFDKDRLMLFDEKNAFDGVIEEGVFPVFSNSYVLMIGAPEEITYVKYSNDRLPKYAIKTELTKANQAKGEVARYRKVALSEECTQLDTIVRSEKLLSRRYFGSELVICPVSKEENGISFPVIEGRTLEECLDEALFQGDMETFDGYLKRFQKLAEYRCEEKVADLDFIFANIIINEKNVWTLIDYEWTVELSVAPETILKRAAFIYLLGGKRGDYISYEALLEKFGVAPEPISLGLQEEIKFQKQVAGDYPSLADYRLLINHKVISLDTLLGNTRKNMLQVYVDEGEGFSEGNSYFVNPETSDGEEKDLYKVEVSVGEGVHTLRLDPLSEPCGLAIEEIRVMFADRTTKSLDLKSLQINGTSTEEGEYFFPHNDPNITISLPENHGGSLLTMVYRAWPMPVHIIEKICRQNDAPKKKRFGR